MCGVGDEGALLIEGALETLKNAFNGAGERSEFGRIASGGWWMEGPRICGDVAGESCEFAQRGEPAMEDKGDERPGDEDEEKHAGGVELDGSVDGMPDALG